jgi:hypothetical protein
LSCKNRKQETKAKFFGKLFSKKPKYLAIKAMLAQADKNKTGWEFARTGERTWPGNSLHLLRPEFLQMALKFCCSESILRLFHTPEK